MRANITVVNQFASPVDITLTREYDDKETPVVWKGVYPGEYGAFEGFDFETGACSPFDYWKIEVVVSAGSQQGTWKHDDWKACNLTSADDGKNVYFTVSGDHGFGLWMDDPCTTSLLKT